MPELHPDSTNEFGKVSSTIGRTEIGAVAAAVLVWSERQPQSVQFIAETIAEQLEALERRPDCRLTLDATDGVVRQLAEAVRSQETLRHAATIPTGLAAVDG